MKLNNLIIPDKKYKGKANNYKMELKHAKIHGIPRCLNKTKQTAN